MNVYRIWSTLKSHQKKVDSAKAILLRAAEKGPMVVSTSWGKDSVVLCDLAIKALGRVPLFHIGGVRETRLPGGEHIEAHFRERTEVHRIDSGMTLQEYMDWLKVVGLPHEREGGQQKRVVKQIKADPGAKWVRENGVKVVALGMRVDERGPRARLLKARGTTYQLANGIWHTNPIAWWSSKDVWAYLVANGLPWHPLYDCESHGENRETLRNTGWLSTDGADRGRVAWLRQHFPEQYDLLEREFPRVRPISGM
jgi:phosphoadenosine phosphosulfate reductase